MNQKYILHYHSTTLNTSLDCLCIDHIHRLQSVIEDMEAHSDDVWIGDDHQTLRIFKHKDVAGELRKQLRSLIRERKQLIELHRLPIKKQKSAKKMLEKK